ncbi:fibronectin type III domain-containing protein [Tamlana sp. 2_MG-2023]|uniref:fibronectin type III domain-containing protein n=1 Tax=unclassified Tamlana TaxID=2614803 RepID=UPI0026E19711|nr:MULTISPECIES: fibronectin type III domain-containing protein [unclassified Tamlana]MDO6761268.1 fibronectin type III domain-containing protein [Tamlana sp. 2_MG-2023]MDO6791751.1 fibronectin type III domain-containing protein [Tamlana sp. 1_MG-2023]
MKKISLLIIIGALIVACSGGDDTVAPKENQAPIVVDPLIYPTNNLLCTTNIIDFEWSASTDPDGDTINYLLEVSQDNQFASIDQFFTVNTTSKSVTLEKNTVYYWRVQAKDSQGLASEYSNTFQFYTEGEGEINHLPFTPQIVAPELNSMLSEASINLQWDCTDVDNDPLVYDVYFDNVYPPVNKVGNNQKDKSLNVNLSAATNYYWQVIAKDSKGGESISQIWSFSTN